MHDVYILQILAWIRGSKEQWINCESYPTEKINNSSAYGKGTGSREKYDVLLKQAVALGFVDILFLQFKFNEITRVCRRFAVSSKGCEFLSDRASVLLMPIQDHTPNTIGGANSVKKKARSTGKGRQFLPQIKQLLKCPDRWRHLKVGEDCMFPGFGDKGNPEVVYCQNWKERQSYPEDFLIRDCQLSIGSTTHREANIKINGEDVKVNVRRGSCEGVKRCGAEGCDYIVSRAQHLNRCYHHQKQEKLLETGSCPINIAHVTPLDPEDGRRWMISLSHSNDASEHNHQRPSPHILPSHVKHDIAHAVTLDPSRTPSQLQKGKKKAVLEATKPFAFIV